MPTPGCIPLFSFNFQLSTFNFMLTCATFFSTYLRARKRQRQTMPREGQRHWRKQLVKRWQILAHVYAVGAHLRVVGHKLQQLAACQGGAHRGIYLTRERGGGEERERYTDRVPPHHPSCNRGPPSSEAPSSLVVAVLYDVFNANVRFFGMTSSEFDLDQDQLVWLFASQRALGQLMGPGEGRREVYVSFEGR